MTLEKANRLFSLIITIIGMGTMYCWIFSQHTLGATHPAIFMMTFNTALCLTLVGLVYLFAVKNSRVYDIIYICIAAFIATLSFLVLVQYIFHVSLSIDQLFISINANTHFKDPGRMSSLTATGILVTGLSMILLKKAKSITVYYVIYLLILTILIMGLFGVLQNKIWALALDKYNFNRMSGQTSLSFILLSSILASNWYAIRAQVGYTFDDINIGNLVKLSILYFSLVVVFSMILLSLLNH